MSKEADLIIIGAGPGGYLNVGCIPTKTYVHSATFAEARERMAQVVTQLRQGVEGILSHPNITLVREKGAFVDACTVNGYTAPHIIIATGSETKWLPIPGTDDPRVVDSTGLLQLDTLPRRLAIIGAGVIGMEFASVFHRFGSEVTVIEYLKECLPALDSDIAKRLRKQMEKEGITFHMQCGVKQIADGEVFFEDKKGNTQSVEADIILMATGRKPRTEGLNLEALGLTLSPNAPLPTDPTTFLIPHSTFHIPPSTFLLPPSSKIYSLGDVNGRQMLAHAAEMQAVRIGPTEDQLKEQGVAYVCKKSFWRANGKALAMGETEGLLKLFITPPSEGQSGGLILGCHAYGAHAADIIQEVSVLMCKHTTVSELADMIHIHPTLSEILRNAVE